MGCGASVGYESAIDPREDRLKNSPVAATLGAGVGFGGDVCCGQQSCCSSSSRRRVPWGWPGSGIRTQALPLLELFQTTAGCYPQVTHEGQWLLKELPAPVRVIALIGQSRAGKSTTCSALARQECEASNSEVLTVGHDLLPVTKGAHAVAVLCPKGSGTVLYIDCEGTDHPLADNLEHSSLAAAVSLGVASQLICCDHGYIRETSLETLADIVAAYQLMRKGPVVRRPDLCMLTVNSRFSAQDPEIEAGFKAEFSSQDDRASTRTTIASAFGELFVRSLPHLDDISYSGALNDLRCELLHRADEVEATGFNDLEERSGEDVLLELQQLCVQAAQGHDLLGAGGDETFGHIVSPRSEGSSAALDGDGTLNSARSRSRSSLLKSHPLRVQVESGAQRAVIFNSCPLRDQVPRLCEALGKRYDSRNDEYVLTRTVGSNVFVIRNTSQLFTFPKGTELMLERGTDVLQKALSAVATAPKSLRPERLLHLNSILHSEAFFVDEAIDRNAVHIVVEAAKSSPGSTEPAMACLGALLQSSNALDWLKDHTWEIDSKLFSRVFEVLFESEAQYGIKTSQGTRPWATLTTSLYLLEALPELSVAAAHQAGQGHGKAEAYAAMLNSIESPEAPDIEASAGLLMACSMVDAADRLGDDALHDEILHDMLEQVDGQNQIAALFEKKHRKQRFTEELLTAFMGLNSELYGGQTSAEMGLFEQEIEALNAKLKKTQDINESLKTQLRQQADPGCVTPGPKDAGPPTDTGAAGLSLHVGGPLTAQMIEKCLPQLVEDGKVALQKLSDQSCASDVVSTASDPDLIRRVVSGVGARVLLGSMSTEDNGPVSEKQTPASTRHGQSTHATASQSSSSQDFSRESSFSLMDEDVVVEFPCQIGSMASQQSSEKCTALAALTSLSDDPFRDAPETQDSICRERSSSDLSLPSLPCSKPRGKGTAPGPPPPRARLQPTQGSGEGKSLLAREGKGKGKGIPPAPAPLKPTRKPVYPNVPLKSLQWTRYLFGHHLREGQTIWDLVPDYAGVVPADEMESRFARTKSSARSPLNPIVEEPRMAPRDCELRLIENAKERMPYEIASMQMPPAEEIVHAIEELDEDMLPLELCREVAKWLCPDGKRLEALKRKRTENPNVPWAMPEHYMWALGHLPACAQRLECWQFLRAFDEEHIVYTESVAQFECVVDGFMRSQSIAPVLGYVLAFGNYLNGGTRLGQADGFNMDALGLLEAVKDQDSKDVRHVIFETFFHKDEDKAKQFIDDLAPCLQNVGRSYVGTEVLKSVKSSIEGLTALVEKIKDGTAQCRSHMDQALALIEDPADLFKLQMPPKLRRTQEAVDQLVDRASQAHRAYRQMLSWYKAGDMISADWCLLWDDFLVPKHLISNRETALRKEVLIPRFCKGRPLDLDSLRMLWQLKECDSVQKTASSFVSRNNSLLRRARQRRTLLLQP